MPTVADRRRQQHRQDQGRRRLLVRLARPRGFCAGVERAIEMLDLAVQRYGVPIYARHAIVHNPLVVAEFEAKGVVFVEDLVDVPEGSTVVFSAHGAPPHVFAEANKRRLRIVDTTCPLVSKVHAEVRHHVAAGRQVLLIGHRGHPEVLGTMGQADPGNVLLVPDEETARTIPLDSTKTYGLTMQTTLSVREASGTAAVLRSRLSSLLSPARDDVCYATTNRQEAVRELASECDAFIVLGGPQSSNSHRLAETARTARCRKVTMIVSHEDLSTDWLDGVSVVGVSSGASTPEPVVAALLEHLGRSFDISIEVSGKDEESVRFGLPASLVGSSRQSLPVADATRF